MNQKKSRTIITLKIPPNEDASADNKLFKELFLDIKRKGLSEMTIRKNITNSLLRSEEKAASTVKTANKKSSIFEKFLR